MKLKTLDLFSGIGGFARGLEATDFFETSCFIEQEPYCQAVLRYHWPDVPVLGDIKNVRRSDLPDPDPDVICGGFPCQPFSHAGRQQAQDDPRHLWPEMFRLIRECRPTWVVGENVAGIISLGLDEVLSDLESEGYATRTFNIPACAVGAPHIRQRIWIVAHADSQSEPDGAFDGNAGQRQLGFGFMADPERERSQGQWPNGSEEGREDSERHAELCGRAVLADARRDTEGCDTELHGGTAQRSEGKLQSGDGGDDVADTERTGTGMEEHRSSGQKRQSSDAPQSKVLRQEDGTDRSEGTTADSRNVADTQRKGEGRRGVSGPKKDKSKNGKGSSGQLGGHGEAGPEEWWAVEPSVGRLVNGLPNRVPQLRALGNSIVPQIAEEIGNAIKVAETDDQEN
jgi:DNA (cytosine-5)-methyltransferase 1